MDNEEVEVDVWEVIWIDHWKDHTYMGLRLRGIVGGDKDRHADQVTIFVVDNGDTDQFEDSKI